MKLRPLITCNDGTRLSVQASSCHYSIPREDGLSSYSQVEVGYITDKEGNRITPPDSWRFYSNGHKFPNDVYAYVPIEFVTEFIASHGGQENGVVFLPDEQEAAHLFANNGFDNTAKNAAKPARLLARAEESEDYILTLDQLIRELQRHREIMGNCNIAIDDNDTGYHLKIEKIRPSNNYPDRLLICGAKYHDENGTFDN